MLKTKINLKLAVIILGIFVLGMTYLIIEVKVRLNEKQLESLISQQIVRQVNQKKILYLINFGEEKISSYQIIPSENSTVFSLLEELAKKENFKIESKIYPEMGVFVESINGLKNGTDNKYWQYLVNNELPMVAANKKEVRPGDKVEWKFEKSPF